MDRFLHSFSAGDAQQLLESSETFQKLPNNIHSCDFVFNIF